MSDDAVGSDMRRASIGDESAFREIVIVKAGGRIIFDRCRRLGTDHRSDGNPRRMGFKSRGPTDNGILIGSRNLFGRPKWKAVHQRII